MLSVQSGLAGTCITTFLINLTDFDDFSDDIVDIN